jgi:hypothetical protein
MIRSAARVKALAADIAAMKSLEGMIAACDHELQVPDIVEFLISPTYLGQSHPYPRQLALLKLATLQTELLTEHDLHVLEREWGAGFAIRDSPEEGDGHYTGNRGLPPDILQRAQELRAQGARWFTEFVFVLGRRAGKTYLSAVLAAYQLWNLLCLSDPHHEFGIPDGKTITMVVLAGNFAQAKSTQYADIVNLIESSPAFAPYIDQQRVNSIRLFTPADLAAGRNRGSIEIIAKEATPLSVRGQPIIGLFIDEAAHVEPGTAGVSADELYTAGSPATDQFGSWSMIVLSSSPATMTGRFYRQYQAALAVDMVTGSAKNPSMFTAQLTSWDTYEDWDIAQTLPMVPDQIAETLEIHRDPATGRTRCFPEIARPIQTYDDRMRRLEEADPASFGVERRAHWAQVQNPFLNPVGLLHDPVTSDLWCREVLLEGCSLCPSLIRVSSVRTWSGSRVAASRTCC